MIVVAATGSGWLVASRVKSPAQLAAETAAPIPSFITYPVDKRVLSSDLIVRGTVRYSDPITVVLAPSLLKPSTVLVSTPPLKGTTIKEGDVALVVSGRPVFALTGAAPAYRDLGPGMSGEDVRQLEQALLRMGFNPGPVDGTYDAATSTAVAAWYTKSGYTPFGPNEQQRATLRLAQSGASQATDRLLQTKQAEQVARQGAKPADIVDARAAISAAIAAIASAQSTAVRDAARGQGDVATRQSAVQAATVALDDLRRRSGLASTGMNPATGLGVTPGQVALLEQVIGDADTAVSSAEADLRSSQATAETVRRSGQVAVADAQTKLGATQFAIGPLSAQQQLDWVFAQRAAQSAVLVADATAAKDNSVAAADVTTKASALKTAQAKAAQARQRLDVAKTGIDPITGLPAVTPGEQAAMATAARQGELALEAARNDLDATRRNTDLTASADAQAIVDATARADAAKARLQALTTPVAGIKPLIDAVAIAKTEVARLSDELAKTNKSIGVQVPANEIVFFPSLPLRIDDTKVKRGDPATADVMTVSGTHLAVDSSLLTTEAALTKLDAPVTIESADYGFSSKGHISFVADKPGLRGTDAQHIAIELLPDDAPVSLVGASVRITIPTKTTNGDALIVPIGALSVRADGATQLQVEDKPGITRTVIVNPGLSAQGFVAVTSISGRVAAGDRVVIGSKTPTTAPGGPGATTDTTPATTIGNTPTTGAGNVP